MKISATGLSITVAAVLLFLPSARVIANPAIGKPCTAGIDCGYALNCYRGGCIEPCFYEENILGRKKCAKHAFCTVYEAHTAGCRCEPGYDYGDPYEGGCFEMDNELHVLSSHPCDKHHD